MITEKQLKVIEMIESNLNIKFKGNTAQEARDFISKHIEESKYVAQCYKERNRKMWGKINEEEYEDYWPLEEESLGEWSMPH